MTKLIAAFIIISFFVCGCNNTQQSSDAGFDRNPAHIRYSKHAKCRMDCRHINETEIAEILHTGTINYKKSELDGEVCRRKYAVEGYSKERQHLRIIFAPCNTEMTVVTVIDLGVEWQCDCR
ncbi:DUF4258 domain-containing protein [Chitinophagaceae bacterium LWZ2-11]